MAGFKIRNAGPDDLATIIRLEEECFPEEPYPPSLFLVLLHMPGVFLLAEHGSEAAGYVVAVMRRSGIGHVLSICVSKRYRRRGLGKKLLESAEKKLTQLGCRTCRLEAGIHNTAALRLYASLGYVPYRFVPRYYPNGEPALVMIKPCGIPRFGH